MRQETVAMSGNYKARLFSASKLSAPAVDGQVACNPVIDLTSTIGDDGSALYIWRANDQLVSKHTEHGQKVQAVKWKEDGKCFSLPTWTHDPWLTRSPGQFIAVGWSDGVVRLVGLEGSKAVHNIPVCDAGSAKINFVAWSRNITDKKSAEHSTASKLRAQDIIPGSKREDFDLPHELTFLEIETALPKISPLPVSGGSGYDSLLCPRVAQPSRVLTAMQGTMFLYSRRPPRSSLFFAPSSPRTPMLFTS